MTPVVALLGVKAMYLLYAWLISAVAASWLSERKGYGERVGLAFGMLLSVAGVIIWLVWPPRADSKWKVRGPFPFMEKSGGETVAEARARGVGEGPGS
ncbi:MAG TPA: hypothetical protein VF715_01000 [Thermoleophilaceae bacterium]|jgi:hypothetical protein